MLKQVLLLSSAQVLSVKDEKKQVYFKVPFRNLPGMTQESWGQHFS
jgi:hypothetical protein